MNQAANKCDDAFGTETDDRADDGVKQMLSRVRMSHSEAEAGNNESADRGEREQRTDEFRLHRLQRTFDATESEQRKGTDREARREHELQKIPCPI